MASSLSLAGLFVGYRAGAFHERSQADEKASELAQDVEPEVVDGAVAASKTQLGPGDIHTTDILMYSSKSGAVFVDNESPLSNGSIPPPPAPESVGGVDTIFSGSKSLMPMPK